jgi:hypothetical protein
MTYDEPRLVWTLVTVLQSLSQYYSRCHSRCQSDSLCPLATLPCLSEHQHVTQHARASRNMREHQHVCCHTTCCVSAIQKARATDRGAKCTDGRDQKVNTSSPEPLSLVF